MGPVAPRRQVANGVGRAHWINQKAEGLGGRARYPAGGKPLEVTTGFCTRSDIQSGHRKPSSFLSKTIHPEVGGNFHVGRYGGGRVPSSDSCSPKLFSFLDFCHHFCHHWWVFLLMAQPSGVAIFVHQILW